MNVWKQVEDNLENTVAWNVCTAASENQRPSLHVFFPLAETPAASGAEQQPTPGRLPLPSQRGVSVPGQDAARREPGYSESV